MTSPIPIFLPNVRTTKGVSVEISLPDKRVVITVPSDVMRQLVESVASQPLPDDSEYLLSFERVSFHVSSGGVPIH